MDRLYKTAYVAVLMGVILCFAGNDEESFLHANRLYQAGDYTKALEMYGAVRNKHNAVWYNTGNCHFHLKNYAAALCAWEKAKKGAPWHENVLLEQHKNDVFALLHKKKDTSYYTFFFSTLALYLSVRSIQILFLLIWYCVLALIYTRVVRKRWHLYALASIMLSSFLVVGCYCRYYHTRKAVVLRDNVSLFNGPCDQFSSVGLVNSADYVDIHEAREGWYKVRYFDTIGWINADALEIIK